MIAPVVLNIAATSGTADKVVVEYIGTKNPHRASIDVIIAFLCRDN